MIDPWSASGIVHISLTKEDIIAGVEYGIISRAWTYDRMGAQGKGDYGKAIFRIAAGRAVQHCLERWLASYNLNIQGDETDYKETDQWDLRSVDGKRIDIKGAHLFTNFGVPGRPALSANLIVNSSNGQEWSTFFPLLIPCDQFDRKPKDCYVFYLLASPSSQRVPYIAQDPQLLITLPYARNNDSLNQLYEQTHTSQYANRRVALGQTFSLEVQAYEKSPFSVSQISIGYGGVSGEAKREQWELRPGESVLLDDVTALHYLRLLNGGLLSASQYRNELLFRTSFKRIISDDDLDWQVYAHDFEDVWIYSNQLYFIGWTTADNFHRARMSYPAWTGDARYERNIDLPSGVRGRAERGTYCYFYPPSFGRQYSGGTKRANYYCLPSDLQPMDGLVAFLGE